MCFYSVNYFFKIMNLHPLLLYSAFFWSIRDFYGVLRLNNNSTAIWCSESLKERYGVNTGWNSPVYIKFFHVYHLRLYLIRQFQNLLLEVLEKQNWKECSFLNWFHLFSYETQESTHLRKPICHLVTITLRSSFLNNWPS